MGSKAYNYLAILSVILAFPGFVLTTSLPPYNVIGYLCIFIALLLFVFWWILNLPLWTVLYMEKKVTIRYIRGVSSTQKVELIKKTKIRANHKGLSAFDHRNIRSDGNIKGFKLNGQRVLKRDINQRVGEYYISERFTPMGMWKSRESELTVEIENAYPNSTEFTSYAPDFLTKKAKFEIIFPEQKPARKVRAYCCIGAETTELSPPTLSSSGLKCTWEGKGLFPGRDYYIEWQW